jgi:hypothetical protein
MPTIPALGRSRQEDHSWKQAWATDFISKNKETKQSPGYDICYGKKFPKMMFFSEMGNLTT